MRPRIRKEAPAQLARELMSRQHHVIGRQQLRTIGVSDSQIKRMLASGELERIRPAVFVLAGASRGWTTELLAALIWLGEPWVAGLRSAARLWKLDDCTSSVLEYLGDAAAPSRQPGVCLHTTNHLPRAHRTSTNGIRLTTPTRTLLDLGAVASLAALEVSLESALRLGLTSVPYLERQLSDHRAPGRRGCAAIDAVLALRRGLKPTESKLETRLFRVLREGGLPLPERQIPVFEGGIFIARPDFLYRDARVAIEGLSLRHHSALRAVDADAARRNRLTAAGYQVLEVTHRQLVEAPHLFVEQVARALGLRLF